MSEPMHTMTVAETEAIDRDLTMTATDLDAVATELKDGIARLMLYGNWVRHSEEFLGRCGRLPTVLAPWSPKPTGCERWQQRTPERP